MRKHGQESAGAEDALRAAGGVARRGRGGQFSVGRKSEAASAARGRSRVRVAGGRNHGGAGVAVARSVSHGGPGGGVVA